MEQAVVKLSRAWRGISVPITLPCDSTELLSRSSPALGAVFAPLALKYAFMYYQFRGRILTSFAYSVKAVSITSGDSIASDEDVSAHSRNNPGTIAGAVIGTIAAISVVIGCLYWYRRRRAQQDYDDFLRSLEKGGSTRVNPFADPVAEQLRAEMSTTVFPPKKTRSVHRSVVRSIRCNHEIYQARTT